MGISKQAEGDCWEMMANFARKPLLVVVGHERSGTIWTTRMLADALNVPSLSREPPSGQPEYEYSADAVIWGKDRPGRPIRRLHYYADAFPYPDVPVLLVIRDPRDNAVSHYHAWTATKTNLHRHALWFAAGPDSQWARYYRQWLADERVVTHVRYEDLHKSTYAELECILKAFELDVPPPCILRAISDNEFSEMENHRKRRGKVGEWREVMEPRTSDAIWEACRGLMEELGYER